MTNGGRYQPIEESDGFFGGEDKPFIADCYETDDVTPLVMTGYSLEWVLLDRKGGRTLVTKTATVGAGEGTDSRASWTVAAADTQSLPRPRTYWHELWRVDSGNRGVLLYGPCALRKGRY